MCTNYAEGKRHDFKLYQDSLVRAQAYTKIATDSGYQGLHKEHLECDVPKKKPRNAFLTKDDKRYNTQLARNRVLNEHVIGKLKRFKVIAERYRNRRKRFALRFNLIAGIYNFELFC